VPHGAGGVAAAIEHLGKSASQPAAMG
jgi:hypothetical protein